MISEVCKQNQDCRPLAVCLNDCEIDSGLHDPALKQVCFLVKCAFAEMRWGSPATEEADHDVEQRPMVRGFAC